jgi:hypothetical protein
VASPDGIPSYAAKPLQVETEALLAALAGQQPREAAAGFNIYPAAFWREAADFGLKMLSDVYKPGLPVPRWATPVITDWAITRAAYRRDVQAVLQARLHFSVNECYRSQYGELLGSVVFWTLDLPASESNHHSYRFGFLDHVFEVFAGAILEMDRAWGDRSFNPEAGDPRVWAQVIAAVALFHDCGKVFDVEVKDPKLGEVWNPLKEPLVLFRYRHEQNVFRPTSFRYRPRRGLRRHEKNARQLLPIIVPPCSTSLIRRSFTWDIDAYLSRYDQHRQLNAPLDQIIEFVQRADEASAAASVRNKNRPGAYLWQLFDELTKGRAK